MTDNGSDDDVWNELMDKGRPITECEHREHQKHPAVEIVQSIVGAGTFLVVLYMVFKAIDWL
jgi:hypothetical protein